MATEVLSRVVERMVLQSMSVPPGTAYAVTSRSSVANVLPFLPCHEIAERCRPNTSPASAASVLSYWLKTLSVPCQMSADCLSP